MRFTKLFAATQIGVKNIFQPCFFLAWGSLKTNGHPPSFLIGRFLFILGLISFNDFLRQLGYDRVDLCLCRKNWVEKIKEKKGSTLILFLLSIAWSIDFCYFLFSWITIKKAKLYLLIFNKIRYKVCTTNGTKNIKIYIHVCRTEKIDAVFLKRVGNFAQNLAG